MREWMNWRGCLLISVDLPKKGSSVCPRSLVLQSLFYEAVPIARELRSLHHNVYFSIFRTSVGDTNAC